MPSNNYLYGHKHILLRNGEVFADRAAAVQEINSLHSQGVFSDGEIVTARYFHVSTNNTREIRALLAECVTVDYVSSTTNTTVHENRMEFFDNTEEIFDNIETIQGVQGAQGAKGTQGTAGTNGAQGAKGAQGTAGTNGAQGSVGAQGAKGTQGTAGTNGAQGARGTQGTAGTNGAQGSVGAQGAKGTQGTAGTNGAQGSVGAQGAKGAQGTAGTNGAQGAQGTQGASGNQILVTLTFTPVVPQNPSPEVVMGFSIVSATHTPSQVASLVNSNEDVVVKMIMDNNDPDDGIVYFKDIIVDNGNFVSMSTSLIALGAVTIQVAGHTSNNTWEAAGFAPSYDGHNHGHINWYGQMTAGDLPVTSGDKIVVTQGALQDTIWKSTITFGASQGTFLANDGSWATNLVTARFIHLIRTLSNEFFLITE